MKVKRTRGQNGGSILELNSSDKELIGEFMGLFAGDGCLYKTKQYHYRVYLHFSQNEMNFVNDLIKNVLIKLFDKKPHIFKRKENRLDLLYISKFIFQWVKDYLTWEEISGKTYSVKLKTQDHNRNFTIGFIRGSLDSDGYLSKKKISFATVSPGLMNDISDFLTKLDVKHKVRLYKEKRTNRKDIYHIDVPVSEREKFLKLIKPRNIKGM